MAIFEFIASVRLVDMNVANLRNRHWMCFVTRKEAVSASINTFHVAA